MMQSSGSKNGKREINAELNLTPFIDLLSTCICFLLLSAVWVEVGSIDIKQSHGSSAPESIKESFDVELFFSKPTAANIYLKQSGKIVKTFKLSQEGDFEQFLLQIDQTIAQQVLLDKGKLRTIATATVSTVDTLDYGNLVSALDVLRKNKITNIGVMTARNP